MILLLLRLSLLLQQCSWFYSTYSTVTVQQILFDGVNKMQWKIKKMHQCCRFVCSVFLLCSMHRLWLVCVVVQCVRLLLELLYAVCSFGAALVQFLGSLLFFRDLHRNQINQTNKLRTIYVRTYARTYRFSRQLFRNCETLRGRSSPRSNYYI
jgi:hypothetical protein